MRQDGVMQQPRDFSLYGAVDLGARQAAAQRSQQAASHTGGPDAPPDSNVIDVTEETFNVEVVERSRSAPVILDLWAEWCGPCKQLSPVLEKLAIEADGAWVLAKVDIDANPQLRAALQVQSIPMVMAVVGGQVVDGFLGAMPEAQVRQWIGQLMQVADQLGMPGGAAGDGTEAGTEAGPGDVMEADGAADPRAPGGYPPGMRGGPGPDGGIADPAFDEAQQAMERGDLDTAAAAFERVLATSPGHPVAGLGLAQVDLIRRVNSYDQAQVRRAAAENPDDAEAQGRVADIDLAMGRAEEAFDRLLGTIRRTSGNDRDQARRHLISLFEVFPPRDPRVTKARSTLSSLLF
jgi:putative thioredoxin